MMILLLFIKEQKKQKLVTTFQNINSENKQTKSESDKESKTPFQWYKDTLTSFIILPGELTQLSGQDSPKKKYQLLDHDSNTDELWNIVKLVCNFVIGLYNFRLETDVLSYNISTTTLPWLNQILVIFVMYIL